MQGVDSRSTASFLLALSCLYDRSCLVVLRQGLPLFGDKEHDTVHSLLQVRLRNELEPFGGLKLVTETPTATMEPSLPRGGSLIASEDATPFAAPIDQ